MEKSVKLPKYLTVERLAPFQTRGTEVGVVLDLMIHDIGIVMALVSSQISKIDAIGVRVLSPSEDIANARIVFENGCVANLSASRVSEKSKRDQGFSRQWIFISRFYESKGAFNRKRDRSLNKIDVPVDKGEPLALELESFVNCVIESKFLRQMQSLANLLLMLHCSLRSR